MAKIKCTKCGNEGEALGAPPYPGVIGATLLQSTCQQCFEEWKKFSVMVINEFKLRPFLPQDKEVLQTHMREFLKLPPL